MNDEIRKDIFNEKYNNYINNFFDIYIKDNIELIKKYPILEIEYEMDGSKKDIYSLASERDIKKMQIKSDKNELDYKFSQNEVNKQQYEKSLNDINQKDKNLNLLYDDLIFNIINNSSLDEIKKTILSHNLNDIDLNRLAISISSVAENKIEEFRNNNNLFMKDKFSYWNYKYNKISKEISKAREVESFIVSLIEK